MNISFAKHLLGRGLKKAVPFFSLAALCLASCDGQKTSGISGMISDMEDNDTLLVFVSDLQTHQSVRIDTVALKDKKFEIQLPDSAYGIQITAKPKFPNGALRMVSSSPVLFFPGDQLKIEGELENFKVTGSELYDGLAKMDAYNKVNEDMYNLRKAFMEAYKSQDSLAIDSLQKVGTALAENSINVRYEAIKANPSSMAAGYLALQLTPEKGLEAINLLSDKVKKSPLGELIEKAKTSYEQAIAKEKAKENIKPGKPAPDFKLKTIDGKEVTLATFKGKYLVLDFWGTWCGWCVKGIPEMKKYYEKYSNKVEFLGIDCRDTEETWREGVAKHKLPWVNVQDENLEVVVKYAVSGFPTKILLDKEGKIVEVFVGESPELYNKMDELFK